MCLRRSRPKNPNTGYEKETATQRISAGRPSDMRRCVHSWPVRPPATRSHPSLQGARVVTGSLTIVSDSRSRCRCSSASSGGAASAMRSDRASRGARRLLHQAQPRRRRLIFDGPRTRWPFWSLKIRVSLVPFRPAVEPDAQVAARCCRVQLAMRTYLSKARGPSGGSGARRRSCGTPRFAST